MFDHSHIPFGAVVELDGYLWTVGCKINNLVQLSTGRCTVGYSKDGRAYNAGGSWYDKWIDYREAIFDQFKTVENASKD